MVGDANLVLGIDPTEARQGAQAVKSNLQSVKSTARSTVKEVDRVEGSFSRLKKAAFSLTGVIGGLSAVMAVRQVQRYSDRFKELEGRLKLVTNSTGELTRVQQRLFAIAQDTRSSFEGTAKLYTRIALSARQLGKSQSELLTITEAVNKALLVGGATTQEATAGTIQLSQALAAGALRGDEFRSVLENMPRITRALEDALGSTRGELIEMAHAGELTSKQVADAILLMSDEISDEFTKLPVTVGQAFQKLDNAFLQFVGNSDAIRSGTGSLALAITALADNFELLAKVVLTLGSAYAISLIPRIISATAAFIASEAAAIRQAVAYRGVTASALVMGSTVRSTSLAFVLLKRAMLALPVVALATLFTQFFTDTRNLDKATRRYGESLQSLSKLQGDFIRANNERRRQIIEDTKDIVKAHKAELESVKTLLRGYLQMSRSRLILEEAGNRLRNILPFVDDRETPTETAERFFRLQETIGQMEDVLSDLEDTASRSSGSFGDLADAIGGGNDKLDDAKDKGKKAADVLKELEEQAKPVAEAFKNAARGIQDSFTGMFRDLLDGTGGFKSFAQKIIDTFKDMMAQLATLAIARPIILPVLSGLGATLGLGAGDIASVAGELGGGSAIGLASGGGSLISGLLNGFSKPVINPGIAFDIGQFLGLDASTVGTLHTGLGNFTAGAGLASFGGNFLANAIFGNRGTGATVGGTLGGLAGTFVGGPIGGAIGSFLGNAIGGLFGGKPSSKEQFGQVDLQTGAFLARGGLTGKKFSQENFDTVTQLGGVASQLAAVLGSTAQAVTLFANNRRGIGFEFQGQDRQFFGGAGEFIQALTAELANHAPELGGSFAKAFANIDFSAAGDNLESVLSDLSFAVGFDKLGEFVQPATQLGQQLAQINQLHDQMAETARRLGLEEAKVESVRQQSIAALRAGANQSIYDQILEIVNPERLARNREFGRFNTQLREIEAVNGDVEAVHELHRLRMIQIEQQFAQEEIGILQSRASEARNLAGAFSGIVRTISNAITDLRLGELSILSPRARLEESKNVFQSTLARALGGDQQAFSELPALGQRVLELSNRVNATNEVFAADFRLVEAGLRQAESEAKRQTTIQEQIASGIEQQIQVMQNGFDAQLQATNELLSRITGLNPLTAANDNFVTDRGTFRSSNANEILLASNPALFSNATLQARAAEAIRAAGFTGTIGGGNVSRFAESNPAFNAAFAAELQARGFSGFARGGVTPVTRPFIVGENGAEVMAPRSSAMVIPFQQNAAILTAIQSSNSHLAAQVKVLQEGFTQLVKETKGMRENTSRMAEDAAIEKRRRA